MHQIEDAAGPKVGRWRGRLLKGSIAVAATAALILGGVVPAQAATSRLTGTVNCTGSWVNYSTQRATTQGPVQTYLWKAAGSVRGGWKTTIGIEIVKTGSRHQGSHPTAGTWSTIASSGIYYSGTRFTMRARMETSSGECRPTWEADLYH